VNRSHRIFSASVVCLLAVCVVAQDAAPPPAPYPSPVTGYVGRYLDSTGTSSWQFIPPSLPRTYRAQMVKADADRDMLYMIIGGSTLVGQTLSTFADRVNAGPLAEINRADPQGEEYLPFEKWVDADRSPGWETVLIDAQEMLLDFDFDDRGYIYLAYSSYGFGIIDEDFQKIAQLIYPYIDISAARVCTFRNGSSYYALVSDGTSETNVYDVTDPSAPVSIFTLFGNDGFRSAAKSTDNRIAFVVDNGQLRIHTPATILASAAPIYTSPATGPFRQVTTDGTNFYALGRNGRDIHILQPSGATYTDTVITSFNDLPNDLIEYGAGYLTVSYSSSQRGAMYRVDGTSLTLLHDGQYFIDWLVGTPIPFTFMRMLPPVFDGQQTLLIGAMHGLGDVFTMTPQPTLTVAAQFAPATIDPSGTSLFTLTITNPNPVPVPFSLDDALPANVISTGANLQTTCGFGVLTAPALTSSFQLTNASVAASSSCTVTVEVTSTVPGTHTITIPTGFIISADNSNSAAADAELIVAPLDAPQVGKSFSAANAAPGVPVRMTITLTNPNALPITGVAFTDNYPVTLLNATTVNALNTCGGTLLAASGGGSLSLSGATVPASQSCTVAVDVIVTQAGSVTNTIPAGAVTSDNADPSTAPAAATISAAVIAGVPTLSQWAMLVMTAVLGLAALLRTRM